MFKSVYYFVFLPCLFFFGHRQSTIPVKGYSLFWSDEFDGKTLNLKKWDYRGLGKRDETFISKETVQLDGKGHLVLKAMYRNDSILTSMISTDKSLNIKYGYFECRGRFAHTPGTISAFWLQSPHINDINGTPETSGAEIDMFEYFPNVSKDHVLHTLHWGGYSPQHHRVEGPAYGKLAATTDDFHTIGFEWTDTSYTTWVDGIKTFSGNQLISKVPEVIILSLGVNQLSAGPIKLESLPNEFVVDYVRVYKKN